MKILFLDIDGVLNHNDWYCMTRGKEKPISEEYTAEILNDTGDLDPISIKRINEIIEKTNCNIVITSTWRSDYEKCIKQLENKGLIKDKIVGKTISLRNISYKYNDCLCRGNEIQQYIKANKIQQYCIIDDDKDMLLEQKNNFVHVNFLHGIVQKDIEKAIKILNKRL